MSTTADAAHSATAGSPGRRRITLRHVSAFLVLVALLITGYLSYTKLANVEVVCPQTSTFNCDLVNNSIWSQFLGVPVSIWGFLAHLAIGLILFLETRAGIFQKYGLILMFGIALFGVLYHGYLLYISGAVLQTFCPWCLAAAFVMLCQLIVTGGRVRNRYFVISD